MELGKNLFGKSNLSISNQSIFYISLLIPLVILSPLIILLCSNIKENSDYLFFFSNSELINYSKNSILILFSVLFMTFFESTFLNILCFFLLLFHPIFTAILFQPFLKILEQHIHLYHLFLKI